MKEFMLQGCKRATQYLIQQLQQASTWRGISLLAGVFGATISPANYELFISVGLGASGLIGAIFSDAKK